ncbi:unnamed protein product [Rotaria magnacalcarata]|uniref:G-protein coupled receptors family 1 profile domain-containing protein n=1 Tax=Rotaria magnacalcarata TaxID=392030 RepID=A0A814SP34_9BILA|nr:unnamed protein product [Rotaria magnacalcarata]
MGSSSIIPTIVYMQQQLTRYACSVWLIFGIPGCLLNVILLSRRQMRGTSCCNYFLGASTIMIISLSLGCGSLLYTLNNPDPATTIRAFCKLRMYILQSTFMMSRWMITIACVDRYASSSSNAGRRRFAHVRIARRVVIIIICIWLLLPLHTLIFYEIRPGGGVCGIIYNRAAALYHSSYTIITGGVFPLTIMLTCILLIRRNLTVKRNLLEKSKTECSSFQHIVTNVRIQRTRDQQALAMLLTQVTVYCFVQTPQFSYTLYAAIASNVTNKSPERLAIERFAFFLAELCVYLFPVTAFYLYILVSRSFRAELAGILGVSRMVCWRGWTIRIKPMSSVMNTGQVPK